MARVTVEDCVLKVPNRFKLVMMAAQRSRELSVGADLTLERDNDKNPVVALREIADETIPLEQLETSIIEGLQKNIDVDEPIEEEDEGFQSDDIMTELANLVDSSDGPIAASVAQMPDDSEGFEDVSAEDVRSEDVRPEDVRPEDVEREN